ncbi:hypothetical protein F3Y22_tig00004796pilonHSYRG00001 [Hibiscus syriacus]|uniref:Uncharacterized protein n=1 Tax=Hibiscus syriacus TaxID=106335 RepID=A0A6A3CGY9_HIBSY|nr:hypothetical protein F3Y22_tig00004796pilonHSYRG00001 [Hibiscus syriacus]
MMVKGERVLTRYPIPRVKSVRGIVAPSTRRYRDRLPTPPATSKQLPLSCLNGVVKQYYIIVVYNIVGFASSSSLNTDNVSTPEELSQIVELPSLGTSYESVEIGTDFVYPIDGWLLNPNSMPWYYEENNGYFGMIFLCKL